MFSDEQQRMQQLKLACPSLMPRKHMIIMGLGLAASALSNADLQDTTLKDAACIVCTWGKKTRFRAIMLKLLRHPVGL